ncbi:hypothetical protein [Nostoc sp. CHAB 5715]|uniref:hypothetical protein n=1 Tax=Nostoc sp. CHAB 5715 TaxID=2780400 RepID=UPI001E5A21DF|nr:hypothetical protein [Nostoc sp. CHAB 5715]MCC5625369.1 hypothetical protein [Nostoc sp. CHAB 5715]
MNAIDDKRKPEKGIQEAWLVRGEETAYELNANSDFCESSGYDISSSKHKQIRSYRNNDQRKNAAIAICDGQEDSGKIRERLKLIEQSFLSYVRSHQEHLEAQIDESRMLERNFLDSIKELEREIDSLASQSEGNEHPGLEASSGSQITQTEENS